MSDKERGLRRVIASIDQAIPDDPSQVKRIGDGVMARIKSEGSDFSRPGFLSQADLVVGSYGKFTEILRSARIALGENPDRPGSVTPAELDSARIKYSQKPREQS